MTRVVLAIGNNRSLSQVRPDLRYADDDAVKVGMVLRALSDDAHVEVLTRVDEETRATLRPGAMVTAPPLEAEVFAAAARLQRQVVRARQQRRSTALYLFFAGHGEQRGGRGFLELEDGTLGRDELQRLVQLIGADQAHVVLDSCNSFFVIHPRRPGGKVWTAADDVGEAFTVPGVDVGVLLSTSAEAQVFEWSQLQSGVFSHAVRSGLLGGADANRDGAVTYAELEGFVAIAAGSIENSLYRPYLYVKPADSGGVFIRRQPGSGTAVELAGFEGRTTLRDDRGVRWADVHPEDRFVPSLVVPVQAGGSILAELPAEEAGRRLLYERELDEHARLTPDLLVAAAESPRGSDALFAQVFAAPFGPTALAEHQREAARAPVPVYGLTRAQEQRFATHLRLLADNRARTRMALTGLALSAAAGFAVGGLSLVAVDALTGDLTVDSAVSPEGAASRSMTLAGVALAASLVESLAAAVISSRSSEEEEIHESFVAAAPRSEAERTGRVVEAYGKLKAISEAQSRSSKWVAWLAPAVGSLATAAGVAVLASPLLAAQGPGDPDVLESSQVTGGTLVSVGIALIGLGVVVPRFGTDTEAQIFFDVVEQDPESVVEVVR